MKERKCSWNCHCGEASTGNGTPHYHVGSDGEMTLADLPIGVSATIVKVQPEMRGKKKFADVGLVAGTELVMEAHAPFGGLLRVKVLETSMALHRDDAAHIVMKPVGVLK